MSQVSQPDEASIIWFQEGYRLWNQDRPVEAIAAFAKAIEIDRDYLDAWYYRGYGLEQLGQYLEALACYDRVFGLDPNHQYAWYRRGATLTKLQRYDEAILCYDQIAQMQPNDYEAWYSRGDVFLQWQRYSAAIDSYKQAIQINPTNCWDWSERVQKLQELHLTAEAFALCQEVSTVLDALADRTNLHHYWIWDSIHQTWYVLGDFFRGLNCYSQAAAAYKKAIQIYPDECLSWYSLARSLEQEGDYREANKCYARTLEIKPNFSLALQGQERVSQRLKAEG
jgi:tetratricopeptide (TPR) repeat protein